MQRFINLFFLTPRRTLGWIAATMVAMLSFGMYLQYAVGLVPCPMCIVQRYCYMLIMVLALAGALLKSRAMHIGVYVGLLFIAAAGLFVAARQSWLQWSPPETVNCGRDFYGMIEQMPFSRAIPQIFSGNGDCSQIDWTFLGGSIANWSLLCFTALIITSLVSLLRCVSKHRK